MDSIAAFVCCSLVFVGHVSAYYANHVLVYKPETPRKEVDPPADDKVWLFAVDGLRRPFHFVDADGSLVGFDVDVISAVCQIAGRRCEMVLAEFTECTYTFRDMVFPGRGLMAGWFDACPGYAVTLDRLATFDFTDPYVPSDASFTVAPGNPKSFEPALDDYSSFTLSHLTGAYTNSACLTRLRKKFGQIVVARDLPEAKALLLNGTTDVLFSPRGHVEGLEVLPARVHCDLGGGGVMVKKGSPLPQWWNPAFRTFRASGQFQQLCDEDSRRFNFTIRCLASSL